MIVNVFLGCEICKGRFGVLDVKVMEGKVCLFLEMLGMWFGFGDFVFGFFFVD